jgi:DNA end-binding protein Ku
LAYKAAAEPMVMGVTKWQVKEPQCHSRRNDRIADTDFAMAPRPYWKGFLRLSLVSAPVALYPASTSSEKVHFHQINRETGNRLHQQSIDEKTGKVVDKDDKGRGYEFAKGKYVEVEEDELDAIRLESTHTIDIENFVPKAELDDRYLDKPYYLVPDGKQAEEAFAVIRDAMRDKGRVALGRVVMANREHVISLAPLGKGMLGITLRYPYEMRDEKGYFADIPSKKMPKDMVDLAAHILDSKAAHFDASKFKDRYEDALRALVKRKAAGKPIEKAEPEEKPSNVINLMDALRNSLKGGKGAAKTAPTRKSATRKSAARGRRKTGKAA